MAAAFDLGLMLNAPAVQQVQQISCALLQPYHNHMFTLYEGERLDDMTESIRKNGVLIPLIVQPAENGKYEILIGHNRWNAAKLAGKETVPAIVKQGLSAEEAEMYVVESNVMQRGFGNLKVSEQAAVVAMRRYKMFSQGKRNDIIRELQELDNPELAKAEKPETGTLTRDKVGEEYGLSGKTVSRLVRIHKLIPELKELVDSGAIALLAGVQLSYLSEDTQNSVALLAEEGCKVNIKKAELLRAEADSAGDLEDYRVEEILSGSLEKPQEKPKTVRISSQTYQRFFDKKATKEEVTETIEKALELYFMNSGDMEKVMGTL